MLETDRPHALRQAIMACRNGGTVSVIGVYGGFIDKFPMGAVMNRSLTIRPGSATCSATCGRCSSASRPGEIDPSFVITHRLRLEEAPRGYGIFSAKEDECLKAGLDA